MAPILPGISDRPEQLAAVVRAAREAGATHLWANVVHLRPGTREHFLDHLARDWPEERERYERLFARGAYLARRDAAPILESGRSTARRAPGSPIGAVAATCSATASRAPSNSSCV